MSALILLAALLLCSAFFSGSETAFFSLDRAARRELEGDRGGAAARALGLLERPRELLVAILFGNVLVNIAYMSVSATLADGVSGTGPKAATHGAALLSLMIFGEVVPKSLTIAAPAVAARAAAGPLGLWSWLSWLLTAPLGALTERVLSVLGRRLPTKGALSDVELARLAALESQEGMLRPSIGDLLEDVLLLSGIRAREVMTPRVDITSFDLSKGRREAYFALAGEARLSKIPVHQGAGLDALIGVLNLKRVLKNPSRPLEALVEPAWFIPETKRLDGLLHEMLGRDATMGIVVDEYGGTSGLVTIEDVVEEIVGDINNQAAVPPLRARSATLYEVNGAVPIRELNDLLGTLLDSSGATTVAGYVARELGQIPRPGDRVTFSGGELRVAEVEKHRTLRVEVHLTRPPELDEHSDIVPIVEDSAAAALGDAAPATDGDPASPGAPLEGGEVAP